MSGGKPEEKNSENGSSVVFHQQLQSEYNALLKRYAEAENTIDQLRTGARIHLYTDPQDAKPSNCGDFENVRHSQRINFPSPSQAVVSSMTAKDDTSTTSMKPAGCRDRKNASSEFEKVQCSSPLPNTKQDESLPMRIQSLKENVDSLENYLSESDITSTVLNEVSAICKELDEEHKELCRELRTYKQSRLSSSSQSEPFCITSKKDLEKELYRIGLRLREIEQEVSRRHKAGKTNCLHQNQQTKEPISRRIILPKSQADASALDPDLTNLLMKLKDLQDASARDNREILRSYRSNDSPSEGLRTNERRSRGHSSSSSPSESHDLVDARYFAASPVQPEYEELEELGNEGGQDAINVDHHRAVDEESYEQVPDNVDVILSNSEDHDWPSQHQKPSSSGTDRHRAAAASDKPVRHANRNHRESYSSGDHESGDHSRPLSPLSDPGNETIHENTASLDSPLPCKHDNSNRNKAGKDATPLVKDQCRKSNSLSSLVDSSRMSTPLFHPRGATRVSSPQDHQGAKYKRRNPADGFDSGFVGSEESRSSRMTTESPDIMRKLNLSNPWDSNLHLDLVSEMDENDSATSHEHLSTTYELATESARRSRSPMLVDRTPRDTGESTLVNSSPSPPSSPDRTRRRPARYFGYSTSRSAKKQPSSEFSSPVPRVRLSDPSLPRISEKTSSERSSRVGRTSGASRDTEGRTGEHSSPGFREATRNVTEDRSGLNPRKFQESMSKGRPDGEKDERDSLLAVRHDIDRLRNQIKNLLDEPRVTLDMYDDHRRRDGQFRETLERRNEQKLDELRESVDRLANDFRFRATSDERTRPRATRERNSHDDLRSQVKNLSEKFDELSELRRSTRRVSESPPASDEDDVRERVHSLAHKLDGLRLRVESDVKQDSRRPNRYFCRLCHEGYHGYNAVLTARKPQTSTPLLSGIYETSRRQPTTEPDDRPTFRHLSSTYPGVQTRSPVVHHIHTYHRTPPMNEKYETDSSSEEEVMPKRSRYRKRPPRRLRSRQLDGGSSHDQNASLAEASRAARDVQRLSKNILNAISLDLASLKS